MKNRNRQNPNKLRQMNLPKINPSKRMTVKVQIFSVLLIIVSSIETMLDAYQGKQITFAEVSYLAVCAIMYSIFVLVDTIVSDEGEE